MPKGTYKFELDFSDAAKANRVLPEGFVEPAESPPEPPAHFITFGENNGIPYAILETEHGKQMVGQLCYTDEITRWTALAGTPGDELFFYAVTIKNGKMSGNTYREGLWFTPISGELVSE